MGGVTEVDGPLSKLVRLPSDGGSAESVSPEMTPEVLSPESCRTPLQLPATQPHSPPPVPSYLSSPPRRLAVEGHGLTRMLIDSMQATTNPVRDRRVEWIPTPHLDSFFFAYWTQSTRCSSPRAESGARRWMRWLYGTVRWLLSILLLFHENIYKPGRVAGPDGESVVLFEIPFSLITGMNYNHPLVHEGQLAIETRTVYRRVFASGADVARFLQGEEMGRPQRPGLAAVAAVARKPTRRVQTILDLHPNKCGSPAMAALEKAACQRHRHGLSALLLSCSSQVEAEPVITNMVVAYWDKTSQDLPGALNSVVMEERNARLLRLVEGGLPAWCVFLPQRNVYYRRNLRFVVQALCVAWPIFTLILACIDLYNSVDFIRDIADGIVANVSVVTSCIWWVVRLLGRLAWDRVFSCMWSTLTDHIQVLLIGAYDWVSACLAVVGGAIGEVLSFVYELSVVGWLVSTKGYLVGVVLPYVMELRIALANTFNLWLSCGRTLWLVISGSTHAVMALLRRVGSIPRMAWQLLSCVFVAFDTVRQCATDLFRLCRHFVRGVQSIFSVTSGAGQDIGNAGQAVSGVTLLANAQRPVTAVISRVYNLVVWVGQEIAKHWLTWVVRPTQKYAHWLGPLVMALGCYGVSAYLGCRHATDVSAWHQQLSFCSNDKNEWWIFQLWGTLSHCTVFAAWLITIHFVVWPVLPSALHFVENVVKNYSVQCVVGGVSLWAVSDVYCSFRTVETSVWLQDHVRKNALSVVLTFFVANAAPRIVQLAMSSARLVGAVGAVPVRRVMSRVSTPAASPRAPLPSLSRATSAMTVEGTPPERRLSCSPVAVVTRLRKRVQRTVSAGSVSVDFSDTDRSESPVAFSAAADAPSRCNNDQKEMQESQ